MSEERNGCDLSREEIQRLAVELVNDMLASHEEDEETEEVDEEA